MSSFSSLRLPRHPAALSFLPPFFSFSSAHLFLSLISPPSQVPRSPPLSILFFFPILFRIPVRTLSPYLFFLVLFSVPTSPWSSRLPYFLSLLSSFIFSFSKFLSFVITRLDTLFDLSFFTSFFYTPSLPFLPRSSFILPSLLLSSIPSHSTRPHPRRHEGTNKSCHGLFTNFQTFITTRDEFGKD